jgi:serine/threonine protein kinase
LEDGTGLVACQAKEGLVVDANGYARLKQLFLACCDADPQAQEAALASLDPRDSPLRGSLQQMLEVHRMSVALERQSTPLAAGTLLANRYRIINKLGEGGMGTVYQAEDQWIGQSVAIKLLRSGHNEDLGTLSEEVKLARQVTHPNVCRVFDLAIHEGTQFLTMEYVAGDHLGSLLRRVGRLAPERANDVAQQICAGLHAAHQQGVLHRDLKPANVLIDAQGQAKLTDFGLASLATRQQWDQPIAGTPAYMAPEQFDGHPPSVQSDIYSLGVLLFELYAGKHPLVDVHPQAPTVAEFATHHRAKRPTQPSQWVMDVDPQVERAIAACLAKDPRQRPPSVLDVAAKLPGGQEAIHSPRLSTAPYTSKPNQLQPTSHRWLSIVGWALAAAVGCVVLQLLGRMAGTHAFMQFTLPTDQLRYQAQQLLKDIDPLANPSLADSTVSVQPGYFHRILHQRRDRPAMERTDSQNSHRLVRFVYWDNIDPQRQSFEVDPTPSGHTPAGTRRLEYDSEGRLVKLEIARSTIVSSQIPLERQWDRLCQSAGIDPQSMVATPTAWLPNVFADQRMAWVARSTTPPHLPMQLRGASAEGEVVCFEVIKPWSDSNDEPMHSLLVPSGIPGAVTVALGLGLMIGFFVLAAINLRRGRGDRRGAIAMGLITLLSMAVTQVSMAREIPPSATRLVAWMDSLSTAIAGGLLACLAYLAVEPSIRRVWPQLEEGWLRLTTARWRDGVLGQHLLVAIGLGTVAAAASVGGRWLSDRAGEPLSFYAIDEAVLTHTLSPITMLSMSLSAGIAWMLFVLAAIVILQPVLRLRALIVLATWLLISSIWIDFQAGPTWQNAVECIAAAILAFALFRYGMLTALAAYALRHWLLVMPTSIDHAVGLTLLVVTTIPFALLQPHSLSFNRTKTT